MIHGPKRGVDSRGLDPNRPGRPLGSKDRHGKARRVDRDIHRQRQIKFAVGISETLGTIMRERDIASSELAAAVGMHTHSIEAHLAGRLTPGVWTILAYAEALGCLFSDLIPEDEIA